MVAEIQKDEPGSKFPRPTRRRLVTLFQSKSKANIERGIRIIMNAGYTHEDIKQEYNRWRESRINP